MTSAATQNWKDVNELTEPTLSAAGRDWLSEYGSLTERIEAIVGTMRLELLGEDMGALRPQEADLLGVSVTQPGRVREVVLFGPEQPWIYARTVIPQATSAQFERLGTRPLGRFLFSQPGMERKLLQVRQLHSGHFLHRKARTHAGNTVDLLWARRCLWRWQDKSMLVSEVFLPDSPIYR